MKRNTLLALLSLALGADGETNVSPDYQQGANAFTGKIVKVTVEQK